MECYDTEEGGDDDDDNFYIGEKRSGGELLGWMFRLGKKVVITGVVISSFPLLVPPLVVVSAVGCALSLPFGVVFASYACTDKLMSKLLLPPEYDEDEQQSVVAAAFEYEQLEEETEEEQGESVVKDGLVVGVNDDASSLDNKQVGGDLEEGKNSQETHAQVDELRMNDVDESNQHTTISEVDDYSLMGMDVYGDYTTTNIPPELEREDIYHVAALELIDAIDKFSTGKEEGEALETRTESVDEIDKFSTGKEDDCEGEKDDKEVETRTESVDELIDGFKTGKEDDPTEEEDEKIVVTGDRVDHMDEEDENVVETRTELVDEMDMFSTKKEDDYKEEEDEKVVETPTESDDEIYKVLSRQKVDHVDKEDGKVDGSRTESIDELDKLELGKEDGHKEEEYEKVLEAQTETVDEIDKFPTGKEDDHKEKQNENIVETPTELVDEIGKFPTGKEVDRVEEDEKVVEAQTELIDEIDKFSTGKEGEKSVETTGKEEEEKSVETQTESADEIDKLPTGEEDGHRKEEEEDEKPVETPPIVFPLPKDTDDKMYSSSGKKSTTSKQVIIERRRGGKRKFKASSSALKLTPRKRKGLSQGAAGELEEEITILKEADQSATSAADKNLGLAGEDAVVHKSGSISSDHAYIAQKAGEQSTMLESTDDDDDDTKQIILLIENRDEAYPVEMNNDNNNATGAQLEVASSLKNSALSDVLDENDGAGAGNETKQQQTVIPTVYNDHPQREENYKQPKKIVSGDSELKNNKAISLKEEKVDTIISVDVGIGHSDEVGLRDRDDVDDENIWKMMEAVRGIIGYKAPANDSRTEELKALFLFVGIEPPTLSDYSAHEFHNNIRFLMSVIGLK